MLQWHELTDGTASITVSGWQFTLWQNGNDGQYYLLSGGFIPGGHLETNTLEAAKEKAVSKICRALTGMLFEIRGGSAKN
jgi:hypothetical protein